MSQHELNPKVFCPLPFVHINNIPNGEIRACCHISGPITAPDGQPYNINAGASFEKAFRSPYMDSLRKNMIAGIRDERCSLCWKLEDQGLRSKRQDDGGRFLAQAKRYLEQKELPFQPVSWDIKLGANCNLKCRMCDAETSAAIMNEALANGWYNSQEGREYFRKNGNFFQYPGFKEELKRLIPFAEEIYFLGGEPTLLREHLEVIDVAITTGASKRMAVRWSTNLTRFDEDFISRARQFQRVILDCSVEGYGAVNEYIRYPSRWAEWENRLIHVRNALPEATIHCVCTIQIYNAFELDKLLAWEREANVRVVFNYLNYPDYLSTQCLPRPVKSLLREKYQAFCDPRLQGFLRWLDLPDAVHRYPDFLAYTRRLDRVRGQDFFALIPQEFRGVMEATTGELAFDSAGPP